MILATLATSLLWSTQGLAAEMKLAYVDIKVAMESTSVHSNGMKRLEALQHKKQKQLEAMRKRLSDLDKELQLQSMAMSNERRASKQQELVTLKKNYDRQLQDASDELKAEKRKLYTVLSGKFYDAIRAYGKTNEYDMIIPKSATIYTNSAYDITADITKILDKK